MARNRSEDGFTLIELLVALAVFSLAALALLNLAGENTRTGARLQDRVLAEVVLDNRAIDALTSPGAPALGRSTGVEQVAGVKWIWARQVSRTSDADLLRIDIAVSRAGTRAPSASATLFRGRP